MKGSMKARKTVSLKRRKGIYPDSVQSVGQEVFFIFRETQQKKLGIANPKNLSQRFEGVCEGELKVCDLSSHNAAVLREIFLWTAPTSIPKNCISFGTGDRLGNATPGHILAVKSKRVFPVLAQQSVREMTRTDRSPRQVIDAATWGVFQTGYKRGFAADADHIKKIDDAVAFLKLGFTLFTIDSSEYIHPENLHLSDHDAQNYFENDPQRDILKKIYLDQPMKFNDKSSLSQIGFSPADLGRAVAIYGKSVEFVASLYHVLRQESVGKPFFLEVSIDETSTSTLPRDHFFVASELNRRGVHFQSLAPRFVGEFQKGIDYIGDKKQFENEFKVHVAIARYFGNYKISIHSGSDKFSIFRIIGKWARKNFHLKTAGTSWLEAMRIVAQKEPDLYRSIHRFALGVFEKDRQSYHVTTDLAAIHPIDTLPNNSLENYFDDKNARQLIHITYGSILTAKDGDGNYLFRDKIYRSLFNHETRYYRQLGNHLRKHLLKLGV